MSDLYTQRYTVTEEDLALWGWFKYDTHFYKDSSGRQQGLRYFRPIDGMIHPHWESLTYELHTWNISRKERRGGNTISGYRTREEAQRFLQCSPILKESPEPYLALNFADKRPRRQIDGWASTLSVLVSVCKHTGKLRRIEEILDEK